MLEGIQVESIEQAEAILENSDRALLEAEMIVLKSRFKACRPRRSKASA